MKNVKKSLLFLLIVALAMVAVMAGCSGNNNEQANEPSPSEGPVADAWGLGVDPLEISLYGHYSWYTMPKWEETEAGKWILENKKVNITNVASGTNYEQVLNTMMASGDLPDVIWMDKGLNVQRLQEAGLLVPFDDYLDKYPNLKKWAGDAVLDILRSPDGKLYQFPNWYTSIPNGNAAYVVNKKIYEELGSPKLETTDELYDYLKLVQATYGDEVVPFDPHLAKDFNGLGLLFTAFGENIQYKYLHSSVQGIPDGDKLVSLFTHPVFRESMQYASKLYREGLMAQDAMTQTLDQITERMMQGRTAVLASSNPLAIGMNAHHALTATDPDAGYFVIKPIHKPGLDQSKIFTGSYDSTGWNVAVITTAAEDPERIFAFLDWYTGPEGMALQFFGPEGTYWNGFDEEGYPIPTDAYNVDIVTELQVKQDPIMWVGNTTYIDPAKAKMESHLPDEEKAWNLRWQSEVTWASHADGTEFNNLDPSPESEEGLARVAVRDILEETLARVLNAKSEQEVDEILADAQARADQAGYQKLLEWRTVKWQENRNILGKE